MLQALLLAVLMAIGQPGTPANTIEQLNLQADVIEIQETEDTVVVYALFTPDADPSVEIPGVVANIWSTILAFYGEADLIEIYLMQSQSVVTLEHGPATVAAIRLYVGVSREIALVYSTETRSKADFETLIDNGAVIVRQPETVILYTGVPTDPLRGAEGEVFSS